MESCRPSSKSGTQNQSGLERPAFQYVNSKTRVCVQCTECGKGRLLYSNNAITRENIELFEQLKDFFVCGLDIFTGTVLHKVLLQHHNNTCNKNMTAAYYSSGPKCFNYQKICSVCTEIDEYCAENDKFLGLPRCSNCKIEKKYHRHQNPIFKRK